MLTPNDLEDLRNMTPPGFNPEWNELDSLKFKAENFIDFSDVYSATIEGKARLDLARDWVQGEHPEINKVLSPESVLEVSLNNSQLAQDLTHLALTWCAMHALEELDDWRVF